MGYDLHITRKQYWADEDGPGISLPEWLGYANGDADLAPDPENPGVKNWVIVSHPDKWPLWWRDDLGEIYTKNPDPPVIRKMLSIANALDARVLGDDDEIYGTDPLDPTAAITR